MAPELGVGGAPSVASDLFATGLSIFEVFSGSSLYDVIESEDLASGGAILGYLAERVESRRELEIPSTHGLPETVRTVIETSCRLDASARFRSAGEMQRALNAAAPAPREQRCWRLAAVLSGDVVGYAIRVGQGVESAAKELGTTRRAIGAVVERAGGRLVDFTGDAFLAEFPSTRAALECSRAIHVIGETAGPPSPDVVFRMGIDVGELLLDDDRLYGNAVNRAARLQALAAPGAVCLSDLARQQLDDMDGLELEDLGAHDLKNVQGRVRVHQLRGLA